MSRSCRVASWSWWPALSCPELWLLRNSLQFMALLLQLCPGLCFRLFRLVLSFSLILLLGNQLSSRNFLPLCQRPKGLFLPILCCVVVWSVEIAPNGFHSIYLDCFLACWGKGKLYIYIPKCSLLLPVVLELTWMLPGSLLRYHEKFHGTVVTAVAVRNFSCTVSLMLGQMLARDSQLHNGHVGMCCLNMAPQIDAMLHHSVFFFTPPTC